MKFKIKFSFVAAISLVFLFAACDDPAPVKKDDTPQVITKSILPPAAPKSQAAPEPAEKKPAPAENEETASPETATADAQQPLLPMPMQDEHYDTQGKTDPFKPLIQEQRPAAESAAEAKPERILTPLEKLELSQIRLVAVIILKNRQLAMVEDPTGKGYEVQVGTYIGKNQGRVVEITEDRLVVKEVVRDFRGRLRESTQELKLHKNDGEE